LLPWWVLFVVGVPLGCFFGLGIGARRSSLGLRDDEDLDFEGEAPRWLWIAGPVLALGLLPGIVLTEDFRLADFSAGSVREQAWFERDGRYFARVDGKEREISKEEYERAARGVMKVLALGFVGFSFGSLVLWQQEEVLRKRRAR
jgi:hypothetical protein